MNVELPISEEAPLACTVLYISKLELSSISKLNLSSRRPHVASKLFQLGKASLEDHPFMEFSSPEMPCLPITKSDTFGNKWHK